MVKGIGLRVLGIKAHYLSAAQAQAAEWQWGLRGGESLQYRDQIPAWCKSALARADTLRHGTEQDRMQPFSKYFTKKLLFLWSQWQKSHWFRGSRILTLFLLFVSLKDCPDRKENIHVLHFRHFPDLFASFEVAHKMKSSTDWANWETHVAARN